MAKVRKEIKLNIDHDNTFDEILLDQQLNRKKDGIVDIPIEKLHSFVNHPFKVLDDEKMNELVESIKENGILSPVVVRPIEDGYELISGGFEQIPNVELKEVTAEQRSTLEKLIGLLEDDEDVTNVYTTMKPAEE